MIFQNGFFCVCGRGDGQVTVCLSLTLSVMPDSIRHPRLDSSWLEAKVSGLLRELRKLENLASGQLVSRRRGYAGQARA